MSNITIPLPKPIKMECEELAWVNLSEISKEEILQKEIFERFIQTGTLSDEDQEFCDSIDWYPVDWLPLREEFIKELKKAKKETPIKFNSVDEFFESIK